MIISIKTSRQNRVDKKEVISYMDRLSWQYVGGTEGIEGHGSQLFTFKWTSEKEPAFPDKYDYEIISE